MCCSFSEKCINSPKTDLGCSTPLNYKQIEHKNNLKLHIIKSNLTQENETQK